MTPAKWAQYRNFTKAEFDCKHTGKNEMKHEFMQVLQEIRTVYARPMRVTSGYRDRSHPKEQGKTTTGEHVHGLAVDIAVSGADALALIIIAYNHGIRRIGVNQKGNSRFIHLGMGDQLANFQPAIWSY